MTQLMRDWERVIVGVGSCGYGTELIGPSKQSLSIANHVIHPFRLAQLQRHINPLLLRTSYTPCVSFILTLLLYLKSIYIKCYFIYVINKLVIIILGDVVVLDLLFSAGLVAILRGVEPRKTHHVSSLALVKRLIVGAKLLQNVSSWNPPATLRCLF